MRIYNFVFIILFICAGSCTYSKFVLTGSQHDPLPEDKQVKVIPWGNQADYEVIGVAEIGESDIETRVEEAKRIARMNGGDVIAPKGLEAGETEEGDVGYRLQNFLILKTKKGHETAQVEESVAPAGEPEPVAPDYPRATFKLLIEEYSSLYGQKFQGALYPYGFIKIPEQIYGQVDESMKCLGLKASSKGGIRVLLMVPPGEVEILKGIVQSNSKFKFVYTPVTVYRKRYPVLEFVSLLE